ncbi:MAG TPA: hypothetical protein VF219_17705, partial [Vicinamibacterales bacterium]
MVIGSIGGRSIWYWCATPPRRTAPEQCGQINSGGTIIVRSILVGIERRDREPPGFRPGFFGFAFRTPRENGEACRFPARRSSSRAFRSAVFSARSATFSVRNAAFSASRSATRCSSASTRCRIAAISATSSSTPCTPSVNYDFTLRSSSKPVNRYLMTKSDEIINTGLLNAIHPALTHVLLGLAEGHKTTSDTILKLKLSEAFVTISDIIIPGSKIMPAPGELQNGVRVANRVVSFILDDSIQYGTGILVGPSHVMTAAHLFFTSTGELIDPTRISRTTIAVETTLLGDIVFKSSPKSATIKGDPDHCFIEPVV